MIDRPSRGCEVYDTLRVLLAPNPEDPQSMSTMSNQYFVPRLLQHSSSAQDGCSTSTIEHQGMMQVKSSPCSSYKMSKVYCGTGQTWPSTQSPIYNKLKILQTFISYKNMVYITAFLPIFLSLHTPLTRPGSSSPTSSKHFPQAQIHTGPSTARA